MFRFEAGMPTSLGEEAFKGLVEMTKRLVIGIRGDFANEGVLVVDGGDEILLQLHPIGFAAAAIGLHPVGKSPIVGQSSASRGLLKKDALLESWAQFDNMTERRHSRFVLTHI